MGKKVLHIASGGCVANDLLSKGYGNVYAFNEAMCEGFPNQDIFSSEFCIERSQTYGVSAKQYYDVFEPIQLQGINEVQLYFDYDMFCCMNAITVLAYLEQNSYTGDVVFNLVEQNGTANVIKSFPVLLGNYKKIYTEVLVRQHLAQTDCEILNRGIQLYLKYKQKDNDIIKFIKKNYALPKTALCSLLLKEFVDYGVGDSAFLKLIDQYAK